MGGCAGLVGDDVQIWLDWSPFVRGAADEVILALRTGATLAPARTTFFKR